MDKQKISEHIFLLPFAWTIPIPPKNGYNFKPHKQISDRIFSHLKGWSEQIFEINDTSAYNEFVYFYKPVRNILYQQYKKDDVLKVYKKDFVDENAYCELKIDKSTFRLTVSHVGLRIIKSGIGILSIYLENFNYSTFDEIQKINSLAECVYPLELPISRTSKDGPHSILFDFNPIIIRELRDEVNYKLSAGKISPFFMELLGKSFTQETETKRHQIYIEPLIGSKMVSLCLYSDDNGFEQIKKNPLLWHEDKVRDRFTLFEEDKYYSLSVFNVVCISKQSVVSKIYDQMMNLLLIQKASLLNFSNQIATISMLPKEELVPAIQGLYEIYIQFINQMYFNDITEDTKGMWVYEKLGALFHIKEEIQQLDFEMKEVHEYAELITREQSKIKVELLTFTGAALVIPTFVTGFFGMNVLQDHLPNWWKHTDVKLWLNTYLFFPILCVAYLYTWQQRKSISLRIVQFCFVVVGLLSMYAIIFKGCGL
ncbi:MAG: hypothetical protein ATN36_05745 [Epulopiscium sp. Nele67-Bin005]|nr:MAG: hypothetical protein ATN36_05745 [Epulopiscium sp. Nele67-Bin005]